MVALFQLVSLAGAIASVPTIQAADPTSYLYRDVVVIGGGASGAHAAVRLREDYNKSVALIEKQAILGGHVNSFTDPETGITNDYGVQTFIDAGNARAFFERLGVDTASPGRTPTTTRYVDFTTGEAVNFTAPTMADQQAALAKYRDLCEQWEHLMQPGYFEFPGPDDIPADLLLPFGEFVTKHGIEAAMPIIWRITGFGTGDIVNELTLYVIQAYGASMARSFLGQQASLVPASGRNQDVYDAIGELLGGDVFYSSTVLDAQRNGSGVVVTVQNSKTQETTVISARRLLMAIEPTAENLAPFNPVDEDTQVFSKFEASRVYAGIVTNNALPVNVSLFNIPEAAAPANMLEWPKPPFVIRFDYIGSNKYFRTIAVGKMDLDPENARVLVQADFDRLVASGVVQSPADKTLQWVALDDHGAMHLRVSAEELKSGFVQRLYALQGKRSTWWTGAAFAVQFQTTLWQYNDVLLEKLVADLE